MSESTIASTAAVTKTNHETTPAATQTKREAPKGSVTEHEMIHANGRLTYRATADWMILRKNEKPVAEMFFVYYSRVALSPTAAPRPITFIFNGGPGAASAYLHVGAVGPRRVTFGTDGSLLPPPTRLVDNESTWLAFSDLVFIDPIGTGFSRTIDEESTEKDAKDKKPEENHEFFKMNRDLDALGEFISKFLSKYNLWSRPVFIAGESYGGFRVAKLAKRLQEGYGIGLNGAILISPALEFATLEGSDYDILMWADLFPSFVAAAVYHGRSEAFPQKAPFETFLPEVERFAVNELVRLLALGVAIPEAERRAIIARAARYMGVPASYIEDRTGRISIMGFARQLLRDQKKVVGLYDASLTAVDPFPDRETFQGADPTLSSIERVFTAGINMQVREALKIETERDYNLINIKANEAWKIDDNRHALQTQIGATDDLRYAMALNPHMKVFITHGVYDLVTPYFSSNRIAAQMRLTSEQLRNLTVRHFKGGHMFYAWEESRHMFRDSMIAFYNEATSGHQRT